MDASKEMITDNILFLYSTHWFDQRLFYYFLIFHKKESKNLVTSKMGNKLNLLQCNFFGFF